MKTSRRIQKALYLYIIPLIILFLIIGVCYNQISKNSGFDDLKRESINPPNDWGAQYNMDQAQVVKGITQIMHFSGQASLDTNPKAKYGLSVSYVGDIRKQMEHTFGKIDGLLLQAGMSKKNILHIRFYTVDMQGFLENYDVYSDWIKPAGIKPPQSLLGVEELALPEMLVEIEVTAGK
ncbi:MAG: hypothetical protein GTO02_00480 [Candidatus Dadabacteria bacterium]|nr:hypothetical protein [Candidatus Dadabacteria bacterium]NIQ12925.1 hypothetical protein [Candidatus Dadabacteria bacterium]